MKRIRQAISRHTFMKSTAAVITAPYIVPSSALGRDGREAPSNRVTMGLIGLGSMGMRHVKGFLQEDDCQIVAVCDVDAGRRNAATKEINEKYGNRDFARYNDFRDMLWCDEIVYPCSYLAARKCFR